jgi:prepilin-type processing-associated H-X9-DG protein
MSLRDEEAAAPAGVPHSPPPTAVPEKAAARLHAVGPCKRILDPVGCPRSSHVAGLPVRKRTIIILSGAVIACVVPWFGLVVSKARARADHQRCASQLIALGQAILLYSNENRGSLPPSWRELCVTQDITSQIFVCPASEDTPASGQDLEAIARQLVVGGHCSYQYLGAGNVGDLTPDVVLAVENPSHHGGDFELNVLFVDGSVRHMTGAASKRILDAISQGARPVRYSGSEGQVMRKGGAD